jgi:hypothetical protein
VRWGSWPTGARLPPATSPKLAEDPEIPVSNPSRPFNNTLLRQTPYVVASRNVTTQYGGLAEKGNKKKRKNGKNREGILAGGHNGPVRGRFTLQSGLGNNLAAAADETILFQ